MFLKGPGRIILCKRKHAQRRAIISQIGGGREREKCRRHCRRARCELSGVRMSRWLIAQIEISDVRHSMKVVRFQSQVNLKLYNVSKMRALSGLAGATRCVDYLHADVMCFQVITLVVLNWCLTTFHSSFARV
jgi:hypothetical protein